MDGLSIPDDQKIDDKNSEKLNEPILDYTVYVASNMMRAKQLYAIEKRNINIVAQEEHAIIVRGQEHIINQLKEFDWVTSIEEYDCYIQYVPTK